MELNSQTFERFIEDEVTPSINDNPNGYVCRYIDGTKQNGGKSITQYYEIGTKLGSSQFGVVVTVETIRAPGTIQDYPVFHLKLTIEDNSILKGHNYIIADLIEYLGRAEKNINLKFN